MYDVILSRRAQRELQRLPPELLNRISHRLRELEQEPRPQGCRKLSGSTSDYRVRVGALRIVYTIDDGSRVVRIFRIRPRGDAYR
jgi:mRNA interferase RelE/StbE